MKIYVIWDCFGIRPGIGTLSLTVYSPRLTVERGARSRSSRGSAPAASSAAAAPAAPAPASPAGVATVERCLQEHESVRRRRCGGASAALARRGTGARWSEKGRHPARPSAPGAAPRSAAAVVEQLAAPLRLPSSPFRCAAAIRRASLAERRTPSLPSASASTRAHVSCQPEKYLPPPHAERSPRVRALHGAPPVEPRRRRERPSSPTWLGRVFAAGCSRDEPVAGRRWPTRRLDPEMRRSGPFGPIFPLSNAQFLHDASAGILHSCRVVDGECVELARS